MAGKKREKSYDERLVTEIMRMVEAHQSDCAKHLRNFGRYEQMYRSEAVNGTEGDSRKRSSNTFVMETFRDVESVVSSVDSIIFGDNPFIEIEPTDVAQLKENIKRFKATNSFVDQAVIELQMNQLNFQAKMGRFERGVVLNGTGVVETPWTYTTRFVGKGKKWVEKPLLDFPDFIPIPITRFGFYPTKAQDIDDAEACFKLVDVTAGELNALIDASEKMSKTQQGASPDEEVMDGKISGQVGPMESQQIRFRRGYIVNEEGLVDVIDYWGKHPLNDSPCDWRIIVANEKVVCVEMPNPYDHGQKPFLVGKYIELDESFYGIGIGQICEKTQIEINQFRNYMRDMMKWTLYNPWNSQGGNPSRMGKFKVEPMKVYPTSEYGVLSPLRPPIEAISFGIKLEEMAKEDMRTSTAATSVAQGLPMGVTATETKSIASETARRLAGIARNLSEKVIKPWVLRAIEMNRQFLDRSIVVMVGGEPVEVKGSNMLPNPNVIVKTANDLEFRPQIQRRLTSAIQTLGQLKQIILQSSQGKQDLQIKFEDWVGKLAKTFGLDPRSAEVVNIPPPPSPAAAPGAGGEPGAVTPPTAPEGGAPNPEAQQAILQAILDKERAISGGAAVQ